MKIFFSKLFGLSLFFLLIFNLLSPSLSFAAKKVNYGIRNFWEVEPGLYRGAQPKKEGYETLKKLGIKTIIDFRKDSSIKKEQAWAEANNIRFVSLPWHVTDRYSSQRIFSFLEMAKNPNNRPLFVHCKQGRDRTGLLMAAYRMYYDGWSEKEAYREMKRLKHNFLRYPRLKRDLHRFALEIGRADRLTFMDHISNSVFSVRNLGHKLWNGFISLVPISHRQ